MTEDGMENWRSLTDEKRSDMLVQLDIFVKCMRMEMQDPETFEAKLNSYNIFQQRYIKAKAIYERLCRDQHLDPHAITLPKEEDRKALINCIITGSDKLFVSRGYNSYSDNAGYDARLTKSTTLDFQSMPSLIVGSALRLEHMRNNGVHAHNLIKDATVVTAAMLEANTPWRCSYGNEQPYLDETGRVMATGDLYYDGQPTRTISHIEATPTPEAVSMLLDMLFHDRERVKEASKTTSAFYDEVERIRDLLVDKSDNAVQFEEAMDNFTKLITSWKDFKENNINLVTKTLEQRGVLGWLKNMVPTGSQQSDEILATAPMTVIYELGDEVLELPVRYYNNEVFIEANPHHVRFMVESEDLFNGRPVYVKAASSRYVPLADAAATHTGINRETRRAVKKRKV